MKKLLFVLVLSMSVLAGGKAMFGLSWNMSPDQVRALGIKIVKQEDTKLMAIYKTDSLPQNHSKANYYYLIFFKDSLLGKIAMIGDEIIDDIYGTDGKRQFDLIYKQLSSSGYETIEKYCVTGVKVYNDPDEFYQCLRYDGCGVWTIFLKNDNTMVVLELNGFGRGVGAIKLSAEASPEWSHYLDLKEKAENKSDMESF